MARPKGSPNKRSLSFKRIQSALERTGHDPLLTQIRFAMGDDEALKLTPGSITPAMRRAANEFILERMYPTLKAVDMQTSEGTPIQIQVINFASLDEFHRGHGPVIDGQSSKEKEQRAALPKATPPSPPIESKAPDPLRVLRKAGERPITDDLGAAASPFGTVRRAGGA